MIERTTVSRWTTGDAKTAEHGGFVAYSDYLALENELNALKSALAVPEDALPPDGQEWAKVSPEVAFHLIERHAENWSHAGQLMEAWRLAVNASATAICDHEWQPMTEPHNECLKCGDVRRHPAAPALPTDTVSRWVFDAFKTNLETLHALCVEFGCQQGDTVVDWLRSRLESQQPTGYCIRHVDGMRWRTLDSMGFPDWTTVEAEALCFSLRSHADAFACDDPEDVRIVPHTWRA